MKVKMLPNGSWCPSTAYVVPKHQLTILIPTLSWICHFFHDFIGAFLVLEKLGTLVWKVTNSFVFKYYNLSEAFCLNKGLKTFYWKQRFKFAAQWRALNVRVGAAVVACRSCFQKGRGFDSSCFLIILVIAPAKKTQLDIVVLPGAKKTWS